MADTDMVTLQTQDGEEVQVTVKVASKSVLIKGIIDDSGIEDPIPLPSIKKPILDKVLEYCTYIDTEGNGLPEIPKPLTSGNMSDFVNEFYANFVNVDQEQLFELILGANFLDIKSLLELSCAKVASLIKGKNLSETRKFFNVENDFSPEEEKKLREELKWAEDEF